jgi:hypothetical protein
MGILSRLFALGTFALFAVVMAASQAPAQPGPFGKGKGEQDRMTLFQNPQVRAELKLTDEQLAKLPATSLKALADVLSPAQVERLRGIYLQQRGPTALLDGDVKKDLKLSDEQAKGIQAALDEQTKGQAAIFDAGGFDPAKSQALEKAAAAKIQSVLSDSQKTAWAKMLGQPIQLAGGFGGGKIGGKGKGGGVASAESLKVVKDFKAELLYRVPSATQGSWVSMCVDPQGRLITSDQGGTGLFLVTPPPLGGNSEDTKVEKIPAPIGSVQGLLWAFDSLYVVVNGGGKGGGGSGSGLYRVKPESPGGPLTKVELLRQIPGQGEHGTHAVLLSPDGKSLFVVCGNDTRETTYANSRLPRNWGEDHLYPNVAPFSGVVPPSGWIAKTDPDGKNWDLYTAGFRNEYDAAFNRHGDLFTYDSDMEWDIGTPWYRPTRISLATSGGDAGFRNGSRVFPPHYVDSLPGIKDIGPGSPTGVTFGYGAKFPAKYQEAFFICDWTFGKLYAAHLSPAGSAYKADTEVFVSGTPFALTDVVINPKDGAMYITVGGRGGQSALYRVSYVGNESTSPSKGDNAGAELRDLRHKLESFHGKQDPKAAALAWPHLGHDDRYIRYAARVAIEHQDVKEWKELALNEKEPVASIHALLALVRSTAHDPITFKNQAKKGGGGKKGGGFGGGGGGAAGGITGWSLTETIPGIEMKAPILAALDRIDVSKLSDSQVSDLLRVYSIVFNRLGQPDRATRNRVIRRFDPLLPSNSYTLNFDLCQMLAYLEAPGVAEKTLRLMAKTNSKEEQMGFAWPLAYVETGWTPALRKEYLDWYTVKAVKYKGGNKYSQIVGTLRQTALSRLTASERDALKIGLLPALPAENLALSDPFRKVELLSAPIKLNQTP